MKVYCKKCLTVLTDELMLYTGKSFGEADQQDFIQAGFYVISDGEFFTGTSGNIIINIEDLKNSLEHPDGARSCGCCGPSGTGEPNRICICGSEIATILADCWMPHAIIFEKDKVLSK